MTPAREAAEHAREQNRLMDETGYPSPRLVVEAYEEALAILQARLAEVEQLAEDRAIYAHEQAARMGEVSRRLVEAEAVQDLYSEHASGLGDRAEAAEKRVRELEEFVAHVARLDPSLGLMYVHGMVADAEKLMEGR